MASGEEPSTVRPLRPATPPDGPLGSSGAAPDPTPVPRPRRPFLDRSTAEPSSAATAGSAPTTVEPTDGGAAQAGPGTHDTAKADAGTTGAEAAGAEKAGVKAADAENGDAEKAGVKAADAEKGDAEKAGASRAGADKVAAETADPNKAGADKTGTDKTADTSKAGGDKTGAEAGDGSRAGAEAAATPIDGPGKEPAKDGANAAKDGAEPAKDDAKAGGEPGRRRRVPFAHAVRLPPPRQAVVGAARATRAWSRRPSGRLTLPGVFLVALVAATAVVGAVVVPSAVRSPKPVAVDATDGAVVVPAPGALPGATAVPVLPGGTALPGLPPATALPGGVPPTGPVAPPATGRPADALAAWAQTTGARVGISPVAMQAYGYAELVLAETNRSCQLSWTTLAAIGYVESRHGQANGASLQSTGRAEPEIIGDPLDGQGGRSRITDTDRGLFDRDTVYDRAIGPMQFIPTTWQEIGVDADNDGRKDPHDLDDAALAAARYVCKGGRNMTIPGDWWGAILSYNDVRRYAQDVFDKANQYGVASRT